MAQLGDNDEAESQAKDPSPGEQPTPEDSKTSPLPVEFMPAPESEESQQPLPEVSETSPLSEEFTPAPEPVPVPEPPVASRNIVQPAFPPVAAPAPKPVPRAVAPAPVVAPVPAAAPADANAGQVALNLNNCTADDLRRIPECTAELANAIVAHRAKLGSFKRLEDLLDVPGMTKVIYQNLTGETTPADSVTQSLNELLGFPPGQHVTLKDVTERISCWPDVTGCVLSQKSGLSLMGQVPDGLDMSAIVAFAPRMFDAVNKSFSEISGKETDELIIPTAGNSFHILRNKDLYLIILSRLPQMPDRHMKVARFVLAWLGIRQN